MEASGPPSSLASPRATVPAEPGIVLLFPISLVFRLLVAFRRLLFRLGVLPSVRLKVPVIIVGNLTVGAPGKKHAGPRARRLLRARGYAPNPQSGYGGPRPDPAR